MTHNDLLPLWSALLRPAFSLALALSFSGGASAEAGPAVALDPVLVDYTRSSMNLSLCAVVFEEEFGDADSATRYQEGSVQADFLIREGDWGQEEVLRAYDAVLQEEFSFTLSPGTTWSSFRRARFTRGHCDSALTMIGRDRG